MANSLPQNMPGDEDAACRFSEHPARLPALVEERTAELRIANERLQHAFAERVRVEEELQASKQTLREVLHGSPIPQFVIDGDHKVLYWNKALERISGIAADEVIGTSDHWRAFYAASRPCLIDLLVDDSEEAIAQHYQDKCRRSTLLDGAYHGSDFFPGIGTEGKWLYFTAAALRDVDGRIVGGVETLEDVTERRLAEIRLAKSQQAAEAANRAKSRFLANMSHEIRTPMTAIMGYLELLAEGCARHCDVVQSEAGNPIDVITQNAKHLLQLIDDILDVSKIEAGKLEVERTACSPCQILAEVVSLMGARAAAKGLTLDMEYAGPMPESIHTDPTRLRQILINIIGNAVKFAETGGVRLVAGLKDIDGEPVLQIEVIDTGIGISAEALVGLFQPFTQADASTSRKFGGTGLGLAVSKRLAELLGGDIEVASAVGKGSTFRLTVPTGPLDGVGMLADPGDMPVHSTEVKTPDAHGDAAPLTGWRLLLAEDGPDNQRFISLVLRRMGADVAVAENGQAAVELATASQDAGRPFDLILMDMQMPVLDGYQAVEKLRAANWSGPIIALTAHAMTEDRQKCLDAGCDDYLTKPIDRDRLRQTLTQWLAPDRNAAVCVSAPA